MKRRFSQRLLAAFLAMVLLVSGSPMAYAAQMDAAEEIVVTVPDETEQAAEETRIPETEAPAEETETAEETEAARETAAEETAVPEETEEILPEETATAETVPEETGEETVPEETAAEETVPEETAPEETVPEETVPEETAVVFAGMPEGYVPDEDALAKKQAMIDNGVLENLKALVAGENYIADQVIAAAADEETAELIAAAYNGTLVMFGEELALIRLETATVPEAVAASLDPEQNLPAVEPNYIAKMEPIVSGESSLSLNLPEQQSWHTWVQEIMTNPDPALQFPDGSDYQWMHDAVDTYAAWGVTTGESWVQVAVIDSGVRADHPDLAGRVTEYDVGAGKGDSHGHGTHVAGIIAAAMDNGTGGAGIAPGVSIQSYSCADSTGSVNTYAEIQAIRKAVANGAHIINLSLSSFGYNYEEESAIRYAVNNDVTVIAAMGNDGTNAMVFPAAYDGVIAVAATDSSGSRAFYSNYGDWADISAPGTAIYSTYKDGWYAKMSGTSMATPVVAGVAALYTSAVGYRVDPAEMEKALEKAATKLSDKGMGAGLINAANLFGGKPDAPFCFVADDDYIYDVKKPVPGDASLYFCESEDLAYYGESVIGDMNGVLVYTLDGKSPSVKDGNVVYGTVCPEPWKIDLGEYAGETLTVKAAFVNGMGIVGKVLSLKLTVETGNQVKSVSVTGPVQMMAGKSVTLSAAVTPKSGAIDVDQGVTWYIYDRSNSMYNAKIDAKTGKLSTPAGQTGWITVRAYSNANPAYYGSHRVEVKVFEPVAKMFLGIRKNGMLTRITAHDAYIGGTGRFLVESMVDKNGWAIDPAISGVQWSSSNPKVATVDQNGNFTAHSKGTATITCTSMDGSNKNAKIKLTVKQQVEYIEITGNASLEPGSNTTLKATVYPTAADNKKVTWSISENPYPGYIQIDRTSGKLTVSKYVPVGTVVQVVATSMDEEAYRVTQGYYVEVRGKCTALFIDTDSYSAGFAKGPTFDKNGYVKSLDLFSVDIPDSAGTDNSIALIGLSSGPNSTYVRWSSSNPSVAEVSYDGRVTAHKAGSATITMAALDGSNKKVSCSVKVSNPVSSMSIATDALRMTNSEPYVAFGKSAKNTVVFADTYGKPTNQKVTWSFSVAEYDSDGDYIKSWTSTFRDKGLISVKNGTLTVSKNVKNYWLNIGGEFLVTVKAYATDGSGAEASMEYRIIPPTTQMKMDTYSKNLITYTGNVGVAYFYSDQWNLFIKDPYRDWNNAFTATSSNPGVASVMAIEPDGKNWYAVYYVASGKTGSAKITITAADGSKKSCSFNVKVPY